MSATLSTRSRFPPAILAGFLVLLVMVGGSLWIARDLAGAARETSQLLNYERALNGLLLSLRRAEVGQRGFVITQDPKYLDPYNKAIFDVPRELAGIAAYGGPRGGQTRAMLEPVLEKKLAELAQTVIEVRAGRRDRAVIMIRTDSGERLMGALRAQVEPERMRIRALVDTTEARSGQLATILTIGLLLGLATLILLAFMWLSQIRREFETTTMARATAEEALLALQGQTTARAAAEDQLRQLQKMETLGSLTGGIAHDFNNMLAVVMGGLELAKRNLRANPDKVDRYLDNAREGAVRAAELTSRLLAFSRKQPLAPVVLDANRLVSDMGEIIQRTLGDNVSVQTITAGGLWKTYADKSQLENAIVNLAVNGRDAMPDGGRLTIETANAYLDDNYAQGRDEVESGQYVVICVTDTGTGMSEEVIANAFDPFFTTKQVGKGTGLGLSQVFGFVKQSGGHVAIYSEVGDGTTVKLYLPRYTGTDSEVVPKLLDTEDAPLGRADEVILVVEDEQRVRHFAVDVLRELGYTTMSAGSPTEALKILDNQAEIALLFTDIVMPDMDGRALAELAQRNRPGLKVLFTTGYTRNSVVHNGKLDIGVAFLAKPYTIAEMARKIRQVLDGEGANRPV